MKNFRHFIFCISGYSKTGKDEFALALIEKHGATKIGIIDVPRRHMAEIFKFTKQQLFGASQHRNRGDLRYKKPLYHQLGLTPWSEEAASKYQIIAPDDNIYHFCLLDKGRLESEVKKSAHLFPNLDYVQNYTKMSVSGDRIGRASNRCLYFIEEGDPVFWLSPREPLQLYCSSLQDLYEDVWVEKFIQTQVGWLTTMKTEFSISDGKVLLSNIFDYDQSEGFMSVPRYWENDVVIVCTDIRHRNEVRYIKKFAQLFDCTPVTIRMRRPGIVDPPYHHRSEVELSVIPDSKFDFVVNNDSTIENLHEKADKICQTITTPGWSSPTTVQDWISGISVD